MTQSTQTQGAVVVVDYSQAMASIARAWPKLRQMDHVTVDEERGEHMRLVVSRGGAVVINLLRRKVLRVVSMAR